MKIFCFLFLIIPTLLNGQIVSEYIYLDYKDILLEDILLDLNKKYNVQTSISSKLSSKCQITLDQKISSIDEAIHICAKYCNLDLIKVGEVYTFKKKQNIKFLFQGVVKDNQTLEPLPYSKITIGQTTLSSDKNGNFSFKSLKSTEKFTVKHLGYNIQDTILKHDKKHIISLTKEIKVLDEFEIISEKKNKVYNMTSGDEVGLVQLNNIGSQFIPGINNNIVFNNLRMYPGIMASGESTSNYIIWGGYPGQGHITFDGITLFSSSGMNGNMGRINPLIINNIQTYKGGYNVDVGDRTGSTVIIDGKEGSNNFNGELNLDNQMTSAYVCIPLFNKSSSLQIAARKTYFNLTKFKEVDSKLNNEYIYPEYDYSDLNLKFSSTLKNKDKIQISTILSTDQHSSILDKKDISSYYSNLDYKSNQIGNSFNYSHSWNKGGWTNLLVSQSSFKPTELFQSTFIDSTDQNYFSGYKNEIDEYIFKIEHMIPATNNNELKFSISNTYNSCNYNSIEGFSTFTNHQSFVNRLSTYLKDKIKLGDKFDIQLGIKSDLLTTTKKLFLQPRINGKIKLNNKWNLTYGWGKYNQYISRNQIIDSVGIPSFIWTVSDNESNPVQKSTHHVLGLSRKGKFIETGIDAYYRTIENIGIYSYMNLNSSLYIFNANSQGIDLFSKIRFKNHHLMLAYSISKVKEDSIKNNNLIYSEEATHSQRHEFKTSLNLNFKSISIAFAGILGSGYRTLTSKKNNINPYSRIDIALKYKKPKYNIGFSVLNLFNTPNTRLFQTTRFNDNSTYSTLGIPFTPTVFLHLKF